jgi:hypothetical protein
MSTYRRVPQTAGSSAAGPSAAEKRRLAQERSKNAEIISNKIHALFWVVLAGFTLIQTNFLHRCFADPEVNRLFFNASLALIAVNGTLLLYLAVYLPYVARVTLPWDVYCPRVIPTICGLSLVCAGTLLKALWPVWGFVTPFILVSVGMGVRSAASEASEARSGERRSGPERRSGRRAKVWVKSVRSVSG